MASTARCQGRIGIEKGGFVQYISDELKKRSGVLAGYKHDGML